MTVSRPALVVTVDGEPAATSLTRVRAADLRLAQRERGYLRAEAERAGREPAAVALEVDVVIDLIGNIRDDTATRSLRVLRPGGLIVNGPTGSWPTMAEEAADAGVRATGYRVAPDGATLAVISRLLESGDVRVYVDGIFDLADAASAHRALEEGHTHGKLVLKVCEG